MNRTSVGPATAPSALSQVGRPVTCWAFPPYWLANGGSPAAASTAVEPARRETRGVHDSTGGRVRVSSSPLLALLTRDLKRGYHRVALRHYLMLLAIECGVPEPAKGECERLLRCCPESRRRQIEDSVTLWLEMVRMRSQLIC